MLDDAADVMQRKLAEPRLPVASEERLALFPARLVHAHARALVAEHPPPLARAALAPPSPAAPTDGP